MTPRLLGRILRRIAPFLEKSAGRIPAVRDKIEREFDRLLSPLEDSVKPYRNRPRTFSRLPLRGLERRVILEEVSDLKNREESRWRDGFVSGAVYHGGEDHLAFLNRVYALQSQSNPLHADLWPSAAKFEAEIVSMTAHMLGSDNAACTGEAVCGTVTSGGTESILLAMKTYRDRAREEKGIRRPEMVVPVTAHAAFDKAADYFGIRAVKIPVDSGFRADLEAARKAINRNTIVVVGSAPSFPHGVIDPIPELSELAFRHGVGFHTDACLGGFVLPWAGKLGYRVPDFDFRLRGVTSVSADTHKFGYAPKGTSVILYRNEHLRHYQYFVATEWPGGLYFSPTIAGSRPGGLSAACWAAMVSMGEQGYIEATRKILRAAETIKEGIALIPEIKILGDPLWVIAFRARSLDIYRILERMSEKGWNLNGLHHPPAVHLCVTLRHTAEGVAERFVEDLREVVETVRLHPEEKGKLAPVYGMAATVPFRGAVKDLLKRYIDLLYKIPERDD